MKKYYEVGLSNSGNYTKHDTKAKATKEAKQLAKESNQDVWVDFRTEDEPILSFRVTPEGEIRS